MRSLAAFAASLAIFFTVATPCFAADDFDSIPDVAKLSEKGKAAFKLYMAIIATSSFDQAGRGQILNQLEQMRQPPDDAVVHAAIAFGHFRQSFHLYPEQGNSWDGFNHDPKELEVGRAEAEKGLALNPDLYVTNFVAGQFALANRDFDRAVGLLKKARALDSTSQRPLGALIATYIRQNRIDDANKVLAEMNRTAFPEAYRELRIEIAKASGDLKLIQEAFDAQLKERPDEPASYIDYAAYLSNNNHPAEAVPIYERAIAKFGNMPIATRGLTITYNHMATDAESAHKYDEGISWAKKAMKTAGSDEAEYTLGTLYLEKGDTKTALPILQRFEDAQWVKSQPEQLIALAVAYERSGQQVLADKTYRRMAHAPEVLVPLTVANAVGDYARKIIAGMQTSLNLRWKYEWALRGMDILQPYQPIGDAYNKSIADLIALAPPPESQDFHKKLTDILNIQRDFFSAWATAKASGTQYRHGLDDQTYRNNPFLAKFNADQLSVAMAAYQMFGTQTEPGRTTIPNLLEAFDVSRGRVAFPADKRKVSGVDSSALPPAAAPPPTPAAIH